MTPVPAQFHPWLRTLAWIALVIAAAAGLLLFNMYHALPQPPTRGLSQTNPSSREEPADISTLSWELFQGHANIPVTPQHALTERFRLAGTFFAFGQTHSDRKAILDDLSGGTQHIVAEGETLGDTGLSILQVYRDHVVFRTPAGEEELWLSFSEPPKKISGATADPGEDGQWPASVHTAEFGGKRIGENRWIFTRDALLDYYRRLREEPERLLAVFDSLKPIYGDADTITGYRVGIEGERPFFDAVGMQEGDIVRSVNSMEMTNRRRAEYFINEFIADRANVFVLDIQRAGHDQKLIYQVR